MINNRQNGRRRGRGGSGPRPNGINNGPERGNRIDNRARGNAHQLHEKYKTLARDIQTQGDRVMAEFYLQFADHYYRILNENRGRLDEQQQQRGQDDQDEFGDDNENASDNGARDYRNEQAAFASDEAPQRRNGNGVSREDEARRPRYTRDHDERPPINTDQQAYRNEPADFNADETSRRPNNSNNNNAPEAQNRQRRPIRDRDERPPVKAEPRVDHEEREARIEMDRLPPALSAPDPDGPEAPKPKRRGRPPRVQPATVEG